MSRISVYMGCVDENCVYDSYRPASATAGQMTNPDDSRQNTTVQLGNVPERFTIGLIDSNRFYDAPESIESKIRPVVSALPPTAAPSLGNISPGEVALDTRACLE